MTWMTAAVWKKCLCWVVIAFFAGGLGTTPEVLASEEKGVKVLTLDEALGITLEKNKDIQKAREYRNMVEGRYIEERAAALPQLQVTGFISRDRDESLATFFRGLIPVEKETRSGEIGLTQALYTFGRIGAAIRAAKVGLATADDQLRIYRQAAFRDVSASFYDILLAKELYALAVQVLEQRLRHLDEARKRFVAGVATEYDVLAAEVAVENARPDVIRAENLIRTSRERLKFLLGIAEQVDVAGSLEGPLGRQPPYGETVEIAWKNRPELSDLRKRLEVAKELVKIYDAGNMPRIDLKAAYGWRQLVFGSTAGDGQEWSAGLYLTFPFFDGLRTRGKVIQARTEVANLKIDEAKQLDSISLQSRDAVNACQESTQIVMALSDTVKQAERLLSMAEKGYEFGVKTKLDVDDAQLNLTQAKGNLARARRDYMVASVTLEWVKGTLEVNKNP
jgi:HAE1 family hydrophobic/amphiphilic exporter-1